ncbi:MAG TPA: PP2C family serine/threonine-protein phosphatase [Gemmata sp.]
MSWETLGESVAGTSHLARDTPCQDAFRVRTYGPAGDWLLVAVADGAGSALHAEVGADLACDEFVRLVARADPGAFGTRDEIVGLFTGARAALADRAGALGVRPRELACTALVALIGPESAAFAQVGDGALVFSTEHGAGYQVMFWPDLAEYANVTDFLTDARFETALRVEFVAEPVLELAVLTDGLQRLALDFATRTPHPAFFAPLFRQLRSGTDTEALYEPFRQFLNSPRVNERTDDDKTLVLAARRS